MPGRGVSIRHWPACWPVDLGETAHLPAALKANLAHRGRDLERLLTPPRGRSEVDGGRQAANHRGEVSLGLGPEHRIEGFLKAVEIHLAAGQESLQEVDPALLEILRDRRPSLGREPVVVHASRLSPDARTDIRAGPAEACHGPPSSEPRRRMPRGSPACGGVTERIESQPRPFGKSRYFHPERKRPTEVGQRISGCFRPTPGCARGRSGPARSRRRARAGRWPRWSRH